MMAECPNLYGIKTCSTVRKARQWLEDHHVSFIFYDYKTQGITSQQIEVWAVQVGWKTLLNRAGMTFRQLSEDQKKNADNEREAIALMVKHPALIKRPILVFHEKVSVGFKPENYAALFDCG